MLISFSEALRGNEMSVEEIIKELKVCDKTIKDAINKRQELYEQLRVAGTEDYDWISVQEASRLIGCSPGTIYYKVNAGELNVRHIKSSVRVRKSEVLAIDD